MSPTPKARPSLIPGPAAGSHYDVRPPPSARNDRTAARGIGSVLREIIACDEQLAIGIEHISQRDGTSGIGLLRQVARAGERLNLALEPRGPRLDLRQADERILNILRCP
jgi:hypothetical protein